MRPVHAGGRMRRGLSIIATGLLLGLVPGVARGAEPGKRLYEQHCAVCHGLAGGKGVYKKAGCPECHGPEARGDGPSAPDLAVKPADLTRRPLKSGPTPQDVYRTLVTGLDGTPMPSYQDALDAEDFWPVVFYIDSLGGPERITDEERI